MTAKVLDAIERNTYYLLRVNGQEVEVPESFPRPGWPFTDRTVSLGDFVASLKE
jgi:hypothetical protein